MRYAKFNQPTSLYMPQLNIQVLVIGHPFMKCDVDQDHAWEEGASIKNPSLT